MIAQPPTAPLPVHRAPAAALALVVALAAALLLAPPSVDRALAVEDVTPARVAGGERTETAAEIARLAHPAGTRTAIVATSAQAQDALTASSLAGAEGAALLLVERDRVPQATAAALDDLGVEEVVIVGDEQQVSAAVRDELAQERIVIRRGGPSQYDTAEIVSSETANLVGLPVIDGLRTVLLANGEVGSFADALAGSVAGYAAPAPILYTEQDRLREEAAGFISARDVEQVVVLGGPVAIAESVAEQLRADGITVTRLAGGDRVQTAIEVSRWTADRLGFDLDAVMLARGDDFPDAVTAAQLGGEARRPLVLSATPEILPDTASAYLAELCETVGVVQAVGGTAAVSVGVLEAAVDAAESCVDGGQGDDALADFTVDPLRGTYDLESLDTVAFRDLDGATRLDVALLPCEAVELDDDGSAVFDDADGDGQADGYGASSAQSARIVGYTDRGRAVGVEQTFVLADVAAASGPEGSAPSLEVFVSAFDDGCAMVLATPAQATPSLPVDETGRATAPYGVSEAVFGAGRPGGGSDDPTGRTYAVEPTAPVEVAVGEPGAFTVTGGVDGDPLTDALDVVLFPCDGADVDGVGPDVFADVDDDGFADGFGETDTGTARVTAVQGRPLADPRTVVGSIAPQDGQIELEVTAQGGPDCAIAVVVLGNGNGELDLDADDRPIERYGIGVLRAT